MKFFNVNSYIFYTYYYMKGHVYSFQIINPVDNGNKWLQFHSFAEKYPNFNVKLGSYKLKQILYLSTCKLNHLSLSVN
jgi:hypothetical protein